MNMTQTYEAIYENGVFRPVTPPAMLTNGQHVRLMVESQDGKGVLELASRVYAGLGEQEIDAIESIALDRSNFFSREGI